MAFTLMELPYARDALAPAISGETLDYHHGKHHKAYIDKTNAAILGSRLDALDLEALIAETRQGNKPLFNNAAQAWNHGFYWHSLTPEEKRPGGELLRWIETSFGSLDELNKQLVERGTGHFASGWVWLVARDGRLAIKETHDADTLADASNGTVPLLVIDLWEHAYYLDHQNARPAYLEQVVAQHLNWEFAAENFARGSAWKYPVPAHAP